MLEVHFPESTDVVLIGAGIMSATLGIMLKELQPTIQIDIFERLDVAAAESSDAWNNAGTGHSAFCELNYTPELESGEIDITKAIKIAESFEISRQFWSYLVKKELVAQPSEFIRSVPHISFVWGEKNVEFLRKRYDALTQNSLFKKMEFSTDFGVQSQWMPLVMKGRNKESPTAATRMRLGTDVNFGSLTRTMFSYLRSLDGVRIHFNQEVRRLKQKKDNRWQIVITDLELNEKRKIKSAFVFIGAGGGSLRLLEKSGIVEGEGYGGFPVGGQWLRCNKQEIIDMHEAKVYGTAAVGAPPMSVPHIDTRMINGKKELLFGPYAGFTTKFLKNGSYLDLPASIHFNNIFPMLSAGFKNLPLTKYLIDQVRLSPEARLDALREYMPTAQLADWELEVAGQRVQVIKKGPDGGGVLEFGTEVVTKEDGTLAVLLGASPGASTSASIMLELLKKCFADKLSSAEWQQKIKEMIPSYGKKLNDDSQLLEEIRTYTASTLGLVN